MCIQHLNIIYLYIYMYKNNVHVFYLYVQGYVNADTLYIHTTEVEIRSTLSLQKHQIESLFLNLFKILSKPTLPETLHPTHFSSSSLLLFPSLT